MNNENMNNNMNKKNKLTYAVILIFFLVVILFGAKEYLPKFSPSGEVSGGYITSAEAKNIVRKFIEDNPELIVTSVQKMQKRQYEEHIKKQQARIKENKDTISSSSYPFLGNEEGEITIVKFYDYRCGHCRHAHKTLDKLQKEDKSLKVVLRVMPLLGADSQKAAKASLAAYAISPTKFPTFHEKLLSAHSLNDNNLKKMAIESGYDYDVLAEKMKSEEIAKQLQDNQKAASIVGLQGVPGFLIGEEFIPGNLPEEVFKEKINKIKNKK